MDENKNQQTPPSNLPTSSQGSVGRSPVSGPSSDNPNKSFSSAPGAPGVRSSIRTMDGDMGAILRGKAPSGVSVKTETQPKPVLPSVPQPTPPPVLQQITPVVKLGEIEKAKPLAPPSRPLVFKPTPPTIPSPTAMTKPIKPVTNISIPSPKKAIFSKQILIVLVLIIAAGVGAYWYFIVMPKDQIAEPTPLPTKTPAPIVAGLVIGPIENPNSKINSFVNNTMVSPREIKVFNIFNDQNQAYSMETFSQRLSLTLAPEFTRTLSIDKLGFILYGQTENFGEIDFQKRFGFITKLDQSSSPMIDEENLLASFKDMFGLSLDVAEKPNFQENIYRGTKIRYRNFSAADQTIDYAFISVLGSPGDSNVIQKYFIITNSRESMYSAIDNINSLVSKLK